MRRIKGALSLILTLTMVFVMYIGTPPTANAVGTETEPVEIDLSTVCEDGPGYVFPFGLLPDSPACIRIIEDGYYKFIGSTTTKYIQVYTGIDAHIELSNVNIDVQNYSNTLPITIFDNANTTLTITGTNSLNAKFNSHAVKISNNAELTINGSGSLIVGGNIGGSLANGSLIINDGTITISTDAFAGIYCNKVYITGGIINTTSTRDSGISCNEFVIVGGEVKAYGAETWCGISVYCEGPTVFAGGTIEAHGGGSGIHISGSNYALFNGSEIRAYGANGWAGIGVSAGATLIIAGGDIKTYGGDQNGTDMGGGAGIGGRGNNERFDSFSTGNIIIIGGTVETYGGNAGSGGAGIGTGGMGKTYGSAGKIGPIFIDPEANVTSIGGLGINGRDGASIGAGGTPSSAGDPDIPYGPTNFGLVFDVAEGYFFLNMYDVFKLNLIYYKQNDKYKWDYVLRILTLDGFNWETMAPTALLVGNGNLTINLEGTNTIRTVNNGTGLYSSGIVFYDKAGSYTVDITGTGILNAYSTDATVSSEGIGIYGYNLIFRSGSVNAYGGVAQSGSGLYFDRALTVNGGSLYAEGSVLGIWNGGTQAIAVNGGAITAQGGEQAINIYGTPMITLPTAYTYWTNTEATAPGGVGIKVPDGIAYSYDNNQKYVKIQTTVFRPEDINGDGDVNVLDLSILLANFGKSGAEITVARADINGDGDVNVLDLSRLLAEFGK